MRMRVGGQEQETEVKDLCSVISAIVDLSVIRQISVEPLLGGGRHGPSWTDTGQVPALPPSSHVARPGHSPTWASVSSLAKWR